MDSFDGPQTKFSLESSITDGQSQLSWSTPFSRQTRDPGWQFSPGGDGQFVTGKSYTKNGSGDKIFTVMTQT